jgi:hypothetical protein
VSRIQGLVNILDDHGQDTFGTTCLLEQIVCESGRSDVRNMLMFADGSHLIRIETAHSNAILKRDHGLVSIFSGILLPSSKIVCAALIKINEPPSCDDIFKGLRGIEWVIFEVKAREKRGLRRDSAFRGMGYLA